MKKLLFQISITLLAIVLSLKLTECEAKEIVVPPGNSISQAAQGASSGDVIKLQAGTYKVTSTNDVIKLSSGMTLQGAGSGLSIIQTSIPVGTYPNIFDERGKCAIIVAGQNITVSGLTIDGLDRKGYGGLSLLKSGNVKIEDVEVKNTGGIGMYMSWVNGLIVTGYKSQDSGSTGSSFSWGAISFYHLSNAVFNGLYMRERKSYAVKSQGTDLSNVKFLNCDISTDGSTGPWNKSSPNFSIEIHTSNIKDSLIVRNCVLRGLLSLATNHKINQSKGRFIVDGNVFIPHRSGYPYYALEMNHGPCLVTNNYAEGFERFIGEWTRSSEIGGQPLRDWVIVNNVASNFVARDGLSNANGRDGFGFINTSANLENAVIRNNTIYHSGGTRFILLFTNGHATGTSRNLRIEENVIHLSRVRSDDYLIKKLRGSLSGITVRENYLQGMRQTGKYYPNGTGIASSDNVYASAGLPLSGDKPFPYYESSVSAGAKETYIPDPGDIVITPPTDPDPDPIKEQPLSGDISIDSGSDSDKNFVGGTSFTKGGINERYGKSFKYKIPVTSGKKMEVSLDLSEIYWTSPGKRTFHVNINGGEYELFQFQPVPGAREIKRFTIDPSGSSLEIEFTGVLDNAKVNSIAIKYQDSPPAGPIVVDVPKVMYKDSTFTFTQSIQIPYVVWVKDTLQ